MLPAMLGEERAGWGGTEGSTAALAAVTTPAGFLLLALRRGLTVSGRGAVGTPSKHLLPHLQGVC